MSEPIKVLSLWQPWASLVAWGDKQIETRSWPTAYRGLVAIHAAKRWTADEKHQLRQPYFREAMERKYEHICHAEALMPLGCIVAVAQLTDCRSMRGMRWEGDGLRLIRLVDTDTEHYITVSRKEVAFGLYSPERFAWVLSDIRALPEPIPFRGMQGLFDAPADLRESLQPTLRTAQNG